MSRLKPTAYCTYLSCWVKQSFSLSPQGSVSALLHNTVSWQLLLFQSGLINVKMHFFHRSRCRGRMRPHFGVKKIIYTQFWLVIEENILSTQRRGLLSLDFRDALFHFSVKTYNRRQLYFVLDVDQFQFRSQFLDLCTDLSFFTWNLAIIVTQLQ